jgi:ribosomal protein S18 acetylase RimI-like enzyme
MNITYTNYEDKDYEALKEMIFGLYNHEASNVFEDDVMSEIKIKNTIHRNQTNAEQLKIKVFKFEKKVVGYAILTFFWSNEYGGLVAILDELYVIRDFRGKGISSRFIDELFQNKEYKCIDLEVFKENDKAIKLYKKLGFEIVDRHFMKKIV